MAPQIRIEGLLVSKGINKYIFEELYIERVRTKEEILDTLPTSEQEIRNKNARLVFIAQAWLDDHAREVDDGRVEFTVPLEDLRNSEDEWMIHSSSMSHYVSDIIRDHENAPEKAKNWSGPFEIKFVGLE